MRSKAEMICVRIAAVDAVVDIAKKEAEAVLKLIDTDEVRSFIQERMKTVTEPLEQQIASTDSWWVKVRNRMYILVLKKAVDSIVADMKAKIAAV